MPRNPILIVKAILNTDVPRHSCSAPEKVAISACPMWAFRSIGIDSCADGKDALEEKNAENPQPCEPYTTSP